MVVVAVDVWSSVRRRSGTEEEEEEEDVGCVVDVVYG